MDRKDAAVFSTTRPNTRPSGSAPGPDMCATRAATGRGETDRMAASATVPAGRMDGAGGWPSTNDPALKIVSACGPAAAQPNR